MQKRQSPKKITSLVGSKTNDFTGSQKRVLTGSVCSVKVVLWGRRIH